MKLNSRRKKFGVIGGVVILFLIIFLPVYFLVLSDSNDDTISNGELFFKDFRRLRNARSKIPVILGAYEPTEVCQTILFFYTILYVAVKF